MADSDIEARIAELEAQVADLTLKLAEQTRIAQAATEQRDLLRAAVDAMPIGVVIAEVTGQTRICNDAMQAMMGSHGGCAEGASQVEVFLPDGATKAPPERDPVTRALHGQIVDGLESIVINAATPDLRQWIVQSARPILAEDGTPRACVMIARDTTEHKDLVRDLDEVVAATVEEKRQLIEKLEAGVRELSTPIIEVWDDVLALPVIGAVDERRGAEMTERLLDEVVARGVRSVIIDWTGVETMNSQSAQHLLDLVRAVELVGAECILTGIRPAVATALLDLDVRFEHLRLLRNVKYGLRHCLGKFDRSGGNAKSQSTSKRPS